jgi:hypothetical protein
MKCLECQNELPDTAISCPRCGTPTRAATSFSYLPAGAPPWPATVTSTAVKQTIESVAPPKAKVVPEAKPRRSIRSVFTAMLLLILSVVIGVGATLVILAANGYLVSPGTTTTQATHIVTPVPTTTPATTPIPGTGTPAATPTTGTAGNQLPTPTSFVVLKVAEVGISLKYPADWKEENPQNTASYSAVELHPQQQLGIDFVVQRSTAASSAQIKSVNDLNQTILQPNSNETTIHNFKLVQAVNPSPTIGGVPWAEQDASFTNSQGLLFHEVSISVQHNNLYYNINYLAPDVVYAEATQKYYSQMLSSFQFLS